MCEMPQTEADLEAWYHKAKAAGYDESALYKMHQRLFARMKVKEEQKSRHEFVDNLTPFQLAELKKLVDKSIAAQQISDQDKLYQASRGWQGVGS